MYSLSVVGQAQQIIFQPLQGLASSSRHEAVYGTYVSCLFGQRLRAHENSLLVL